MTQLRSAECILGLGLRSPSCRKNHTNFQAEVQGGGGQPQPCLSVTTMLLTTSRAVMHLQAEMHPGGLWPSWGRRSSSHRAVGLPDTRKQGRYRVEEGGRILQGSTSSEKTVQGSREAQLIATCLLLHYLSFYLESFAEGPAQAWQVRRPSKCVRVGGRVLATGVASERAAPCRGQNDALEYGHDRK